MNKMTSVIEANQSKKRQRILVVDDDRLICWSLRELFSNEGYEVHAVETGEDAVREAERSSFDLIITDLKLPGINGWDVLSRIKVIEPQVKVIMISAFGNEDITQKASDVGASFFLGKPIEIDNLKSIVNTMLQGGLRNQTS